MPQFKKGDKVRLKKQDAYGSYWTGEMTVAEVRDPEFDISCNHPTMYRGAFSPSELELVKPEPKFKVGDRVRTKLGIWCYGLDKGAVGVVRALSDDPTTNFPYKVSFPEKGDGYVFLAESEIEPAPTQEFKLRPGDVVKNLKTGRLGVVVPGRESSPHPERRSSYVIDLKHIPTKDRVPTRLLEEYEAQYPGTYDLVVGESAPW